MMNPLFEQEWEEFEVGAEGLVEEEAKQRFAITSMESLNWAFRKLHALKLKESDIKTLAASEQERIAQWEAKETREIEQNRAFFESLIAEYASKRRAEDDKFKKEKTPYGSITFTKQLPEYVYDDAALLGWLEENEYYDQVKVTKSVANKSELKKMFTLSNGLLVDAASGNIVQGVTVVNRPDKLKIEL